MKITVFTRCELVTAAMRCDEDAAAAQLQLQLFTHRRQQVALPLPMLLSVSCFIMSVSLLNRQTSVLT